MTDDMSIFQTLQRLAQIDDRFLREGLADPQATMQLYGFKLTAEQMRTIEEFRTKMIGRTDDQIQAELRENIRVMRP